jgi:CheY-like chemotaxis protein
MVNLTFRSCLIAEDESFMRRVLLLGLQRLGARVFECANGREALAALNTTQRIDFALLDIVMPEMHGLYVLKQIRIGATRQAYDMPVALLTATREEGSVQSAASLSCNGFLLKPVSQSLLSQRIEQMLNQHTALPHRPPHYESVDVGTPGIPPNFNAPVPTVKPPPLGAKDLLPGMVLTAPLSADGKIIVPPGTPVTPELLVMLQHLDRVKSLGPIEVTGP